MKQELSVRLYETGLSACLRQIGLNTACVRHACKLEIGACLRGSREIDESVVIV